MPRGYADHPEDERLHHTITRTDERFDLWRFIIITVLLHIQLTNIYISYLRIYYNMYVKLGRGNQFTGDEVTH